MKDFLADESGQGMTEYCVLVFFITLMFVGGALALLGTILRLAGELR